MSEKTVRSTKAVEPGKSLEFHKVCERIWKKCAKGKPEHAFDGSRSDGPAVGYGHRFETTAFSQRLGRFKVETVKKEWTRWNPSVDDFGADREIIIRRGGRKVFRASIIDASASKRFSSGDERFLGEVLGEKELWQKVSGSIPQPVLRRIGRFKQRP